MRNDVMNKQINQVNRKCDVFLNQENFRKCMKKIDKMVEKTANIGDFKTYHGQTLLKRADLLLHMKRYEEAIIAYKKALKELNSNVIDEPVYKVYQGLYNCHIALNNDEAIIRYGMLSCEYRAILPALQAEINTTVTISHIHQYKRTLEEGDLIGGITYSNESLRYYKRQDESSRAHVKALLTASELYYYLKEQHHARSYFDQATEISQKLTASDPLLDALSTMNQLLDK